MAIWRFEVAPKRNQTDPVGRVMRQSLSDFGIQSVQTVRSARVFLIDLHGDHDNPHVAGRIARDLLTDPVIEDCSFMREGVAPSDPADALVIEVHFKPGVMDNVALSTQLALAEMEISTRSVRTARRFELLPVPDDRELPRISRLVGNASIEDVFIGTPLIKAPPEPPRFHFRLTHVPLRNLDAAGLDNLSREGHLFLSREEMLAIQQHYQALGRDPTDLELETLAQTWSEHCVHKTLKSAYEYRGTPFPTLTAPADCAQTAAGASIVRQYDNLLRDTIARATKELMAEKRGPECLSVFVDNAGVIAFDDAYGVAFKVETHNHPSAIEPYGGASTGVGGVIRDVLGCGLGAKPIANTDVFCVAPPDWPADRVPKGVIHPRTSLRGIVAGVRDYGNRMGIPTVNGAVQFDPRYLGNPLVYCGCVGLIRRDRIQKAARPGDALILIGGRTGRDGIHGATFSSAELTDTHQDEFAHAVQIGNAIEEKKVLDFVLRAGGHFAANEKGHSRCLFSAITDCGAGGLSSAVGEMGAEIGVEVDLDKVPLKYAGLRYDEIWISEAQERMVLSVPPENVADFLALAKAESVEATIIGRFTDSRRLVVRYEGAVVGDMEMAFLHEGLPCSRRVAEWSARPAARETSPSSATSDASTPADRLRSALADPTTASKHWIFRQYDHEVQAGSVVKPWAGCGEGPTDAAVVRPRLDSSRGIAVGCGLAPQLGDVDPYWMAVASIDEAVRNVVCVGGDPRRTAILDNFCWPSSDDPVALGALVRTCQACYDMAKLYGLPFISGKDSLNNVFAMTRHDAAATLETIRERFPSLIGTIEAEMQRRPNKLSIPYTLLISAISLVKDVRRCITPAVRFTESGEPTTLYYVGTRSAAWPDVDMQSLVDMHRMVAELIQSGDIVAAHDVSDGGVATAITEMAMACHAQTLILDRTATDLPNFFAPPPSAYIVQPSRADVVRKMQSLKGILLSPVATLRLVESDEWVLFESDAAESDGRFDLASPTQVDWDALGRDAAVVRDFRKAWRGALDW